MIGSRTSVAVLAVFLSQVPKDEAPDPEKAFRALWVAAEADPKEADFAKVRELYAKTPGYRPYSLHPKQVQELARATEEGDLARAERLATRILTEHPLALEPRLISAFLRSKAGDKKGEARDLALFQGQLKAITEGKHGKDPADAFVVLSVLEEYDVLKTMGDPERKGQAHSVVDGHHFDVLTVIDPKTKAEREVYFNIDAPWGALSKSFNIKVPGPPEVNPK